MFNDIFGWGKNKANQHNDWSSENDENIFQNFRQQSEEIFKNFEILVDGFGFGDINKINEFSNLIFESQFDQNKQLDDILLPLGNEFSNGKLYSLRDSMLKEPEYEHNFKTETPPIFSSAYQFSNIFGLTSANGIFEKKMITKGPDGIEKIVISRGVGDQIEETIILKDSQGRILSQESATCNNSLNSAMKTSNDQANNIRADVETTIDNIVKEYNEPVSFIRQGLMSIFSTFFGQKPTTSTQPKQTNRDLSGNNKPIMEHPKDKKALSLYERFFGGN